MAARQSAPQENADRSEQVPPRLSQLLRDLAGQERQAIRLGQISRALRERGFAAIMVVLAAPNLFPTPPGLSTVFGIPLVLLSLQLLAGYRKPLLPRAIRMREIAMDRVRRTITAVLPWIIRFERIATPRLWLLPQRAAERLIGGVTLLMALILILPIPFGNFFPGLSVLSLCVGLSERDGLFAGFGLLMALVACGVIAALGITAGFAAMAIF